MDEDRRHLQELWESLQATQVHIDRAREVIEETRELLEDLDKMMGPLIESQ
jgi:hypothetical protein